MTLENHRKQANTSFGKNIDWIEASEESFDEHGDLNSTETSRSVSARIESAENIANSNKFGVGNIPKDALLLHLKDIAVDSDDLFKIDGERFEVMGVIEPRGTESNVTGRKVLVKPTR